MQQLCDYIEININSLIIKKEFKSAQDKAKFIKNELIESATIKEKRREFNKHQPFQDYKEID